jgi:hypothetical protein
LAIVLVKGVEAIKNRVMGAEAGIPLMYQPMDLLCNELPVLLLEPLHHRGFDKNLWPFSAFLRADMADSR